MKISDLEQIPKLPENHEVVLPVCEIPGTGHFKPINKISVDQLINRIVKGVLEDGRVDVYQEEGCIKFFKKACNRTTEESSLVADN